MYNQAYKDVDTDSLSDKKLQQYSDNKDYLELFNQTINEKKAFDKDIRLNLSLTWILPKINNAKLTLYGQNLFNLTDNKRQKINFTTKPLPALGWVEEKRNLGLRYTQQF